MMNLISVVCSLFFLYTSIFKSDFMIFQPYLIEFASGVLTATT